MFSCFSSFAFSPLIHYLASYSHICVFDVLVVRLYCSSSNFCFSYVEKMSPILRSASKPTTNFNFVLLTPTPTPRVSPYRFLPVPHSTQYFDCRDNEDVVQIFATDYVTRQRGKGDSLFAAFFRVKCRGGVHSLAYNKCERCLHPTHTTQTHSHNVVMETPFFGEGMMVSLIIPTAS